MPTELKVLLERDIGHEARGRLPMAICSGCALIARDLYILPHQRLLMKR